MSDRPKAPDNLSEEATLEWHRFCDELSDAGKLDKADRAILILYVETWSTYREMMKHFVKHGAVVKFGNGVAGNSPQYKTARETANFLRATLADLGLTPTSRAKVKSSDPAASAELSF